MIRSLLRKCFPKSTPSPTEKVMNSIMASHTLGKGGELVIVDPQKAEEAKEALNDLVDGKIHGIFTKNTDLANAYGKQRND